MLVRVGDWCFRVDMEETMEYSAAEAAEHCDCAYCRNFYASVDKVYPEFRPFLANFGIDIEAPEILMPFTPTCYLAVYCVKGAILSAGKEPLSVCGINVEAEPGDEDGVWQECFTLRVGEFSLPWVLNEPAEDVISPANLPSFLDEMRRQLIHQDPDTPVT